MKIACVDRSAAARLKLRHRLESAYESGRATIGHLPLARLELLSKDDLSLSFSTSALSAASLEIIAVGDEFTLDESYATCREIADNRPDAKILVFLSPENYHLRSLRRFERLTTDIFAADEPPTRLLHTLSRCAQAPTRRTPGRLVTVTGVKGGVGATSMVSGFAHAAESLGKSAVIIDLSLGAALLHYMGAARWQSSEYATSLLDGIHPDAAFVERLTVSAPNGITLLLPPAGSTDIRELWLRDPRRLEATLAVVEHLKDQFDIVLVDIAGSEGLLPFALNARAHVRLLVSSNEPASIHLLSRRLTDMSQIPGEGTLLILLNQLVERGLTEDDLVDFLHLNRSFEEEMCRLRPMPFDSSGRNWIGTGNTFYTEGRSGTQAALELCLARLLNPTLAALGEDDASTEKRFSISKILRALPQRMKSESRTLPLLTLAPQNEIFSPREEHEKPEELYEPPRLVVNE